MTLMNIEKFNIIVPFSSTTASHSNIKKRITLSGLPSDQCNKVYRVQNVALGPNQLCAGGVNGFDRCRADSGGPLMAVDQKPGAWYLIGVISIKATPCENTAWPGVSTRVGPYIDWISSHIREYIRSTIDL